MTECQQIIKELRKATGMNRRQFCEEFEIPYRTVTEWEYYIQNEKVKKENEQKVSEN